MLRFLEAFARALVDDAKRWDPARIVVYQVSLPGPVSHGVLYWEGAWPMRKGKFPTDHPCSSNPRPYVGGICAPLPPSERTPNGRVDGLTRFRSLGYCASCYPEGDGFVFRPPKGRQRTVDEVKNDVRSCFGWTVQ